MQHKEKKCVCCILLNVLVLSLWKQVKDSQGVSDCITQRGLFSMKISSGGK